jgi:hypothetical protein
MASRRRRRRHRDVTRPPSVSSKLADLQQHKFSDAQHQ